MGAEQAKDAVDVWVEEGSLRYWSRIWNGRNDIDYEIDLRMIDALKELERSGVAIEDHMEPRLSKCTGYSEGVCKSSFQRLFWAGNIKRIKFSPPAPSIYKISTSKQGAKVRRTPLGKYGRFRPPKQANGKPWGAPAGGPRRTQEQIAQDREALIGREATHFTYSRDGSDRGEKVSLHVANSVGFTVTDLVRDMHPKVGAFCLALSDGASVDDAASEAGLSKAQADIVLPKIRSALADIITSR